MKSFRLSEDEWAESLSLATTSKKKREEFWARLGEQLGFDPATVDMVRPLVFRAEPTRKTARTTPVAPPETPVPQETPPERSSGRRTASKSKVEVRVYPKVDVPEPVTATVVATKERQAVMLDQVGCARCGAESHHGITYRKLGTPIVLGAVELTHYAWCPRTGEPILLKIYDESGNDVRVPADLARLLQEQGREIGEEQL